MVSIPQNIKNELIKSESRYNYLEVLGLSYEDAEDIVREGEEYKGWEAYSICNEKNYDVFFLRTPMEEKRNVEDLIKKARVNFREEFYSETIKYANEYLKGKNNPDYIVYGLLGIAYQRRIRQIRIAMETSQLSVKEKQEKNAEIEMYDRYSKDYLRIYSYFNGCDDSKVRRLDTDLIASEVEKWISSVSLEESEEKLTERVNDLNLDLLNAFNKYIKNKESKITIEQAGKQMTPKDAGKEITPEDAGKEITPEDIDKVKIAYARIAIRANLPLIARKYISCLEKTPNRTKLVDAKLSLAKEELRFMQFGDSKLVNKNVRRLIRETNGNQHKLVFVKPGNRVNKKAS